jgi:hypothetical protein
MLLREDQKINVGVDLIHTPFWQDASQKLGLKL